MLTLELLLFEAANGQRVEADQGRLVVPENRRRSGSRTIEIAFVRFKSATDAAGPPIVYLAGGPGGSGIATARGPRTGRHVPDFIGTLEAIFVRLEEAPVTVAISEPGGNEPVTVTLGPFDLQLYLADLPGRLGAIQAAPAAVVAMSRGDFAPLAEHARLIRGSTLYSAMSCMMDCASGASSERCEQIRREERESPLAAAINFPFPGDHLLLSTPETGELMVRFMKGEPVSDARIAVPPLALEPVATW
jgi:hypothetical protein